MNTIPRWGEDPVSQHISEHIASLPDLPPVCLVVVNWNSARDSEIISSIHHAGAEIFASRAFKIYERSFQMVIVSFYADSQIGGSRLFSLLRDSVCDEAALYFDGKPGIQLCSLR